MELASSTYSSTPCSLILVTILCLAISTPGWILVSQTLIEITMTAKEATGRRRMQP